MLKKYFTDGLIGVAILLSLFRTDLIDLNINNLINYPEVQDIILGQTAAYLPANFHSHLDIHNGLNHPKHIEFDNDAISALYRNFNVSSLLRAGPNNIEAFLVSEPQNVLGSFDHGNSQDVTPENNEDGVQHSSSTISQESVDSQSESDALNAPNVQSTSNVSSSSVDQPLAVDVTFLFNNGNNPFPGCNLSREDLALIDALWRQDEDLGVGKEVYDQHLREELEREREREFLKEQEKERARLTAHEKAEKARQEQADRWLKQHFMQDGETGEWVKLQNTSSQRESTDNLSVQVVDDDDDFLTLEAALDYLSSNATPGLLELDTTTKTELPGAFTDQLPLPSYQLEQVSTEPQPVPEFLENQDHFDNTWNEIVDYLNITDETSIPQNVELSNDLEDEAHIASTISEPLGLNHDLDDNEFLLQNATLPTNDLDIGSELCPVVPMQNDLNQSLPSQAVSMNTTLNWNFEDMGLFTGISDLENVTVEELNFGVDDLFGDMDSQNTVDVPQSSLDILEDMESVALMGDNLSETALSLNASPSETDLRDCFDGLEGATGGSNYSDHGFDDHADAPFKKLSRMSESSTDSGFSYDHGRLPSSSSSSCSSYAGSPSNSGHGNSSTASNDTEHDPPGSRALTNHHIAHNHTYNTLPGQIPREVKKYAQKPSSRKGPQSRDQKRAHELKVPFSVADITDSPVETFNEMLTKHDLTEPQLTLVRDIRRRGKNKVAAQNCRKRKVGMIVTLADEMEDLHKAKERLLAERMEMERETRRMKEKFGNMYNQIFQSLRDERGQPYDQNLYSLQQSSDGNVFLVPRNISSSDKNSTGKDIGQSKSVKKRKSLGN